MSRRLLWVSVLIGRHCRLLARAAWLPDSSSSDRPQVARSTDTSKASTAVPSSPFLSRAHWSRPPWPSHGDGSFVCRTTTAAGDIRLQEWALILTWCLLAVAIQGLLRLMAPFPLGVMFASDASNSFYSVALKFNVESILGDFERLRPTWALHAQSNLPGKLLLVRALVHISTRADVLAWMIVVFKSRRRVRLHFRARPVQGPFRRRP